MSTTLAATATVHRRPRLAGWVLLVLRLGMAGVFVGAAVPKIAAPDLFALAIHNYQMLPPWGVNGMAVVLPWLELIVGACLAAGIWRRASALVMTLLMVVFMIALMSAAARGLSISCGCFEVGESAEKSSLVWALLRDAGFLAATLVLVRFDRGPRPLDLLQRRRAH
jgi:uncharacterized membrane protein YphA (DoxX/SURF4 family)